MALLSNRLLLDLIRLLSKLNGNKKHILLFSVTWIILTFLRTKIRNKMEWTFLISCRIKQTDFRCAYLRTEDCKFLPGTKHKSSTLTQSTLTSRRSKIFFYRQKLAWEKRLLLSIWHKYWCYFVVFSRPSRSLKDGNVGHKTLRLIFTLRTLRIYTTLHWSFNDSYSAQHKKLITVENYAKLP